LLSSVQLLEPTIEHALLGFLRQSPMHGYKIHKRLSNLGAVWVVKQSQLYALLSRLEKEGYIVAALEPQDSRPPRKVFHLTASGQKVFLDWVRSPVPHGRQIRLDFLLKLYFAEQEGAKAVSWLLQQQRLACQTWLAQLQTAAESLDDGQQYQALVCQFRIGQIQAMLDWLGVCEQTLAANRPVG
jgi:DNA-binding PadR family transcriptional regulator